MVFNDYQHSSMAWEISIWNSMRYYQMSPYDISNYTKNIYQQIPAHVSKNVKDKVKEAIENSFNGREGKRLKILQITGKACLLVCSFFLEKSPGSYITQLLVTLAEIQELLYSPKKDRNIKNILQLYRLTFVHASLIKRYWENDLKILTQQKFFGVYYHLLMIHEREQYRIASRRTANTEHGEATFTDIKKLPTKQLITNYKT